MGQVFNIDKVLEEKTVVVGDKRYTVQPITLRHWGKIKDLEKKERAGTLLQSELIDVQKGIIHAALPDFDVEDLPINVILPLFEFICKGVEEDTKKK